MKGGEIMPNIQKMEDLFDELLKKYDSAARGREQANAVRYNEYDRELANIKQTVTSFKKRFAAAKEEA